MICQIILDYFCCVIYTKYKWHDFLVACSKREKLENHKAPPVLFEDLLNAELLKTGFPAAFKAAIDELLEVKKHTTEKEEKPQMPVIRAFIETETARQKGIADQLEDDHNRDWTALNQVFREVLGM